MRRLLTAKDEGIEPTTFDVGAQRLKNGPLELRERNGVAYAERMFARSHTFAILRTLNAI